MRPLVLITGATGFLGRQVTKSLRRDKVRIRVVVRDQKQVPRGESIFDDVESVVVAKDAFAESSSWWERACDGVDTVIHLAWFVQPGVYLSSPKNLECLSGTLELAKGAASAGIGRFVGIGTCFEYDLSGGVVSTATPLRPLSLYAGTKAGAFFALDYFFREVGVSFSWCRPFYLYGEGEDSRRLIPYLHQQLARGLPAELSSGIQIRDYLDVEVAGQMVANIALSSLSGAANICSGVGVTVRDLAERIADTYGRRDLLRFGARPENLMDPPCVVGVR